MLRSQEPPAFRGRGSQEGEAVKKLYLTQIVDGHEVVEGQFRPKHLWRVEKVVGSTLPKIGATLSEKMVQAYCQADEDWVVEIK